MNKKVLYALLLTATLMLSACNGGQSAVTPADATPTTFGPAPAALTPTPSPTNFPVLPSNGPLLLIQTDNGVYEVIDFTQNQRTPINLPDGGQRIGLASALSPSKTLLKSPIQAGEIQFFDLLNGSTKTVALPSGEFDVAQTAALAQAALPEMALTDEAALSAVTISNEDSLALAQWFQDDDHLLIVTPGSPTSTQLTLFEISTGQSEVLETLPGLVETVIVQGDLALLKKGYISEPGYWQDDRYALLGLSTGEVQAIELPEDSANPILNWFGPNTLSITHQSQPVGGYTFSILDLEEMERTQVIEGLFSSVQRYQGGLLVFRNDPENYGTILEHRDLAGQVLTQANLAEQCTPLTILGENVLVNCETESLIFDSTLTAQPFSGPVFLLAGAPDGATWVRVERSGQTTLLDSALGSPQPIELEGAALEVRWLPDSTGFLYRTLGQLFLYDLAEGVSTLILESDLLGDYANLNAVWIGASE